MRKKWTFLVYLAGDNNLESFGRRDLAEMKAVGSTPELDIVAQFDGMGDGCARRYHLHQSSALEEDAVATLPETNTGDPQALLNFLRWGLERYPADRTALVLWNHGAGWKDDDLYRLVQPAALPDERWARSLVRGAGRSLRRSLFATSVQAILQESANVRGILFDDTSKDFLDNGELKRVLDAVLHERQGAKLDLIGFDACLMNMVEVAAQVQHAAHYMVGSQEDQPGEGWPYSTILAALAANPAMSAEDLSCMVVQAFASHYGVQLDSGPLTQSAVRLERMPRLVTAMDRLAGRLVEKLPEPAFYSQALLPAARQVQKFRDDQYVDLGHLAQLLVEGAQDEAVAAEAGEVLTRLGTDTGEGTIVAAWGSGAEILYAGGLSVYFPSMGFISPAYGQLEFARQCPAWPEFLQAFLET